MQFEYDIFISYSRKDNKPMAEGGKGWVSQFQHFLEVRLTQLLGDKPKFLHYSNEEKPAASELIKASVLVSVLSPNYTTDGFSIEDIDVFYTNAEKQNNLKIGEKERIFKVVKTPVSFEQHPSKVRHLLGYDMYAVDPDTGNTKEVVNFFDSEAEKNFWMRLDDLAHDIYHVLKEVKIHREKSGKAKAEAVYLAETGHDLTLERDLIKRELQRHGYKVLPDYELPTNVREMEAAVRKDLKECKLSIHLIGDSYGEIPEGTDRSIVDIQNQLAAEHSNFVSAMGGVSQEFNRLIWVSPYVKLMNERQKLFIENIKRDAESITGAEVVQTPLEDLKNIIRNELLNDDHSSFFNHKIKASDKTSFYLIFDKVDEQEGNQIADFIKSHGIEVYTPSFKGELLEVRSHHFDNLRQCDVALIYYGKVSEQWVQMKVLDVLKAPGLGRVKPMKAKAIFVERGPRLNREKFQNYNIAIIENTSSVALSLEPLMAKLK